VLRINRACHFWE